MGLLRLRVDSRSDIASGAPLVASVLTEDLETVTEVTVPLGGMRDVQVGPGSYVIRAVAPTGSALTQRASVGPEASVEVELGHVASPHEWLELHALLGEVSASGTSDELGSGVWLRVWRWEADGTWTIEPVTWTTTWESEHVLARAAGLQPAQRVLQVGGESIPWRLLALPSGERIEVLLRRADGTPELDAGVEASVVTDRTSGEVLHGYLARGRTEAAGIVAEEMLQGSRPDGLESPTSAAVLGYYLVRRGQEERLAGLALVERFPWLPDAWILEGWRALRGGDEQAGRAHLLRAASMGAPLHSEGMRLLSTGLRLLEAASPADADLRSATESLSAVAAATNWGEPLTTYYGLDPTTPTLAPPTGIPDGPHTRIGPDRGGTPPPRPRWGRWVLGSAVVAAVIVGVVWWATRGGGGLAIDPSSLDYGERPIEAAGASEAVTLSNDTGAEVLVRNAKIRGPDADDFDLTTDTCSGVALPDGRSCSLVVSFTPTEEGAREARLVIRIEGEGGPIRVPLDGTGVSGEPEEEEGSPVIVVDPPTITFPADVREGAVHELTITNDGDAVLEVAASVDPADEGIALDPDSVSACAEIQPGDSCTMSVLFVPFRGSRGEANVVIENNAIEQPLQVRVSGTPRAGPTPAEVGTTDWDGSQANVLVRNTGTRAFTPAFDFENQRFSIASHTCGELVIGGECAVNISFDAEGAEDLVGALVIEDGSGEGPVVVPLEYPTPVD
ncbi:MAG TPA: choice-of-anchor D domain-containing protein [Actinomycetota bacterium]